MPQNFAQLVGLFIGIIQLAIPVVGSLALLAFFVGVAKFIANVSGDEKAVTEGKNLMLWGIIALFVMISVWGILRFFYNDIGFAGEFGIPLLPEN